MVTVFLLHDHGPRHRWPLGPGGKPGKTPREKARCRRAATLKALTRDARPRPGKKGVENRLRETSQESVGSLGGVVRVLKRPKRGSPLPVASGFGLSDGSDGSEAPNGPFNENRQVRWCPRGPRRVRGNGPRKCSNARRNTRTRGEGWRGPKCWPSGSGGFGGFGRVRWWSLRNSRASERLL